MHLDRYRRAGVVLAAGSLLTVVLPDSASAVILAGETPRNTVAPTGALREAGWDYTGLFNEFVGTPISRRHFITAGHIGGAVGDRFAFNGQTYRTTAAFDDPGSDLRIWEVNGDLPRFATLSRTGAIERGKDVVLIGRGTQRGAEIRVGGELKGWQWGAADGALSWGTNTISDFVNYQSLGAMLKADFSRDAGPNEGTFSSGDSGGSVWFKDEGVWKLVGIGYGVDGPYSLTAASGSSFEAAVLDQGGLYTGGDGGWDLQVDVESDLPASLYAIRVVGHLEWIDSVIASAAAPEVGRMVIVPEPSGLVAVAAAGGSLLLGRRRR